MKILRAVTATLTTAVTMTLAAPVDAYEPVVFEPLDSYGAPCTTDVSVPAGDEYCDVHVASGPCPGKAPLVFVDGERVEVGYYVQHHRGARCEYWFRPRRIHDSYGSVGVRIQAGDTGSFTFAVGGAPPEPVHVEYGTPANDMPTVEDEGGGQVLDQPIEDAAGGLTKVDWAGNAWDATKANEAGQCLKSDGSGPIVVNQGGVDYHAHEVAVMETYVPLSLAWTGDYDWPVTVYTCAFRARARTLCLRRASPSRARRRPSTTWSRPSSTPLRC
ncbi:MAG: hypothetical protein OXI83_15370 [Gemmatimonadota bacterium]|nr:hypothetical protein [Gemmatimonadota bacterium]